MQYAYHTHLSNINSAHCCSIDFDMNLFMYLCGIKLLNIKHVLLLRGTSDPETQKNVCVLLVIYRIQWNFCSHYIVAPLTPDIRRWVQNIFFWWYLNFRVKWALLLKSLSELLLVINGTKEEKVRAEKYPCVQ